MKAGVFLRTTAKEWRGELPDARKKAVEILESVRNDTVKALEEKAQEWKSENKLIHAGAALTLAKELKEKTRGK